MRSLLILLVVLLGISEIAHGIRWGIRRRSWPSIRIVTKKPPTTKSPPTTSPPRLLAAAPVVHSSGLPYCKATVDISALLKSKSRRKRSTLSWPYDCVHSSIIKYEGAYQFITPLFQCCQQCESPRYPSCVVKTPTPSWLCPSDGFQCVLDCVSKHNPSASLITPGVGSISSLGGITTGMVKPGITKVKQKCTKEEVVDGKKCIRQLCIPLALD